jgi:hypothetical protein
VNSADEPTTTPAQLRQGSFYPSSAVLELSRTESAEVNLQSGFVVVTQTCDLVRVGSSLQVASAERLTPDEIAKFGARKSPRYFCLEDDLFADFDFLITVQCDSIARFALTDLSLSDERAFRQAVARKFGRIAAPTHVVESLRSFRKYFIDKSKKPDSAPGRMLGRIGEIRIAVEPDWSEDSEKESIHIYLLLDAEDVLDDNDPERGETAASAELQVTLNGIDKLPVGDALVRLTALMDRNEAGSRNDFLIWNGIVNAFMRMIQKGIADLGSSAPKIGEVIVDVQTRATMSLAEADETDQLDLAHLSGADD